VKLVVQVHVRLLPAPDAYRYVVPSLTFAEGGIDRHDPGVGIDRGLVIELEPVSLEHGSGLGARPLLELGCVDVLPVLVFCYLFRALSLGPKEISLFAAVD